MNNNGYNGNASLKRIGIELPYTEKEVLELAKCVENPIYFSHFVNFSISQKAWSDWK